MLIRITTVRSILVVFVLATITYQFIVRYFSGPTSHEPAPSVNSDPYESPPHVKPTAELHAMPTVLRRSPMHDELREIQFRSLR